MWDKEKIWVPDKNRSPDLPNTGQALFLLTCENLWRTWTFNWVHIFYNIIYHLYSIITTHNNFDSADPSSMQDACYIWTQLNDNAVNEFS